MLKNAKVSDLMIKKFVRVTADEMIWDVIVEVNKDKETRVACIVDGEGRLKGIITPKMFLKKIMLSGLGGRTHSATHWGEVLNAMTCKNAGEMMAPPHSLKPEQNIDEAIQNMLDKNLFEMPVVDADNRVIGELNFFKIISKWAREAKHEKDMSEEE